jgi:hypothetical protein
VFKKNISDGVGSRNELIGIPLYPPLFWLDNIFKCTCARQINDPLAGMCKRLRSPGIDSKEIDSASLCRRSPDL